MPLNLIDEINVVPVKPKFGLIAFASFVLFDSLYVSNVAVYTRPYGGIRLVYPRKKNLDVFHPINSGVGSEIEKAVKDVMEKYELI